MLLFVLASSLSLTFGFLRATKNKGAIVYSGTPAEVEADPEIRHTLLGVCVGMANKAKFTGSGAVQ